MNILPTMTLAASLAGGSGYNIDDGSHSVVIEGYDQAPRATLYNIESGSTTVIEFYQSQQPNKDTNHDNQNQQRFPIHP